MQQKKHVPLGRAGQHQQSVWILDSALKIATNAVRVEVLQRAKRRDTLSSKGMNPASSYHPNR